MGKKEENGERTEDGRRKMERPRDRDKDRERARLRLTVRRCHLWSPAGWCCLCRISLPRRRECPPRSARCTAVCLGNGRRGTGEGGWKNILIINHTVPPIPLQPCRDLVYLWSQSHPVWKYFISLKPASHTQEREKEARQRNKSLKSCFWWIYVRILWI